MKSADERFWNRVQKSEDGCCLWTGAKYWSGYGRFQLHGKNQKAHRLMWILTHWFIPKWLCVLHTCDVRDCVNPDHLFLGTRADNLHDMAAKGMAATGDRHSSKTHPECIARGDRHSSRTHPERIPRGGNHPLRKHPELAAWGDRNGARTHPEKRPRGDRPGSGTHPECVPRGEASGQTTLTEFDVCRLRRLAATKLMTYKVLACQFGVSAQTAWNIAHRRTWKHVA